MYYAAPHYRAKIPSRGMTQSHGLFDGASRGDRPCRSGHFKLTSSRSATWSHRQKRKIDALGGQIFGEIPGF